MTPGVVSASNPYSYTASPLPDSSQKEDLPPLLSEREGLTLKIIAQLAFRILFSLGTCLVLASALPPSFHATLLPAGVVGAVFLSGFFFQPEVFVSYWEKAPPLPPRALAPVSPLAPRGMCNGGNNCWLHAILQSFRAGRAMSNWFASEGVPRDLRRSRKLLAAYERVPGGGVLSSKRSQRVREEIADLSSIPRRRFQADAAEGLSVYLNFLPDAMKMREQVTTYCDTRGLPLMIETDGDRAVGIQVQNGSVRIRRGEFAPPLLHVPIQGPVSSLPYLLEHYFNETVLESRSNENAGIGSDGGLHRYPALRKEIGLVEAPPLLFIQLVRFEQLNPPSSVLSHLPLFSSLFPPQEEAIQVKNGRDVEIPPEIVITPLQGPPQKYRLVASILHVGESIHQGHYIARVLGRDGRVYQCDDDEITLETPEKLLSPQAYVLHYKAVAPEQPAPQPG